MGGLRFGGGAAVALRRCRVLADDEGVMISVSVGFVVDAPGGKRRGELEEEIRGRIVEVFRPERVHVNVFFPKPVGGEHRLVDLKGAKRLE